MNTAGKKWVVARLSLIGTMVVWFLGVGCQTSQPTSKKTAHEPAADALPLVAGFVYEEELHTSGKNFSTEACFANALVPEIGTLFQEATLFADRANAVNAGVDILFVGKALVYGTKEKFKYSLELQAMNSRNKTILRESIKQKTFSMSDCETSFTAEGQVLRRSLATSPKLRTFAGADDRSRMAPKVDRSKSPWAKD